MKHLVLIVLVMLSIIYSQWWQTPPLRLPYGVEYAIVIEGTITGDSLVAQIRESEFVYKETQGVLFRANAKIPIADFNRIVARLSARHNIGDRLGKRLVIRVYDPSLLPNAGKLDAFIRRTQGIVAENGSFIITGDSVDE